MKTVLFVIIVLLLLSVAVYTIREFILKPIKPVLNQECGAGLITAKGTCKAAADCDGQCLFGEDDKCPPPDPNPDDNVIESSFTCCCIPSDAYT